MNNQVKIQPTATVAWHKLTQHQQAICQNHMRDLFLADTDRAGRFSIESDGIHIDYSKHRITSETLDLLFSLATETKLKNSIDALFNGSEVNLSEQRPALHTTLRAPITVTRSDTGKLVHDELQHIENFINKLRSGQVKGYSGKPVATLVNIGIGGSDLGPRLVTDALKHYKKPGLNIYFVANIDAMEINDVLLNADSETTMFIISSKSFSTEETLTNAISAKQWLINAGCNDVTKHFIAVTANSMAAQNFGIPAENIFRIWDWMGGRYSVWSAVGLPAAASIGMDNFRRFLAGAHNMDEHFRIRPLAENIPVILGLLDIWYINFFSAETLAVIPYDQSLTMLPDYLSQLIMESNGKFVDQNNRAIDYKTSPIIWGGTGTNAQHTFMQLLHQGTHLVPVDFLAGLKGNDNEHHKILLANCIAQGEALMAGNSHMADKETPACKIIPGNNPSTTIMYDQLTPETLGMLLALYEHRTFVQASIWNINSFDQWGVELGKKISVSVKDELAGQKTDTIHDSSTRNLIQRYLNHK